MSTFPEEDTIFKLAIELNTEPAFLEKDWHVSNALKALTEFENELLEPIFCGGTSLLKGYKIISRFSEDVDFRILNTSDTPTSRGDRRNYRDALINHLSEIPELDFNIDTLERGDNSRFFSIQASYPKRFGDHASIRPELKLEGTFVEETLPGLEEKEIKPIVGDYVEVTNQSSIRCLSLLETTADKSSALVWRVLSRNREEEGDDPTIIRHLYDLYGLITQLDDIQTIIETSNHRYQTDRRRGGDDIPDTFNVALENTLEILETDPLYREEYTTYALNMCFGKKEPPKYDKALRTFSTIIT